MKSEEFNIAYHQIYTEFCKCKREHTIITQKDSDPEYTTDIYLLCGCGEYIHFVLPVN